MVQHGSPALDGVFRALSDPTRREMLRRLSSGTATITELAAPFAMSFAGASKHLRALESAGLVSRTVHGRSHSFSLQPAALSDAHQWLSFYQKFWTTRLDALDALLRTPRKDPSR